MSYPYRNRRRRKSYSGYSDRNYEHARRHIREGEALSRELGGTDEDVKRYFFSLSTTELGPVLREYERDYGTKAREYAEETIPRWRSGRVKMGGQTASRLFKLLPKYMPPERKNGLVESLWTQHAPKCEATIFFGANANVQKVREAIREQLNTSAYSIPEPLQRRFQWLSGGDSVCYQQMLNHFRQRDRDMAIEAATGYVATLLRELPTTGGTVQGFTRIAKVGGHAVHVVFDHATDGLRIKAGAPHSAVAVRGKSPDFTWVLWVIGIIAVLWILSMLGSSGHHQYHYRR